MPYNKKGKHYRKLRRRNNWRKVKGYGHSALDLASKALNVANATKKLLNVERKMIEATQDSDIGCSYDYPVLHSLTLPTPQGTGNNNRVGRSLKWESIDLRALFTYNSASTASTQNFRVVIFKKIDFSGSSPTISDVLDLKGAAANANTINAFRNIDNTKNIKVLFDKSYSLSAEHRPSLDFHYHLNPNMITKYAHDATGGALSDIETNVIFFMAFSTTNNASNPPQVRYQIRSRFIDN